MRKLFIALLLICTSIFSQATPKETMWVLVPDASKNGTRNYFDLNSIEKYTRNNIHYTVGTILIVPESPTEVTLPNGRKVRATSMARHLIVDCDNALTTNFFDVFFTIQLPARGTVPLGGIDYSKSSDFESLSRSSPLFLVMCPTEV